MKPKEYVKNVLITEAREMITLQERFSQIDNIRLLHAAMGLSSELAEIQTMVDSSVPETGGIDVVNLKEEMGDLLWYMGVIVDVMKFDPDEVFASRQEGYGAEEDREHAVSCLQARVHGMVVEVGTLVDFFKKTLMYGKILSRESVFQSLTVLDMEINSALILYGIAIDSARERNIEKLRARYGEKFTEAAALERNLRTERSILESK
jgi:NTP pyrophosphatase (non-canonical NTP hydrolase)